MEGRSNVLDDEGVLEIEKTFAGVITYLNCLDLFYNLNLFSWFTCLLILVAHIKCSINYA